MGVPVLRPPDLSLLTFDLVDVLFSKVGRVELVELGCEVTRRGSYIPRQVNDAQKQAGKFRDQVLNRDVELAGTEINSRSAGTENRAGGGFSITSPSPCQTESKLLSTAAS